MARDERRGFVLEENKAILNKILEDARLQAEEINAQGEARAQEQGEAVKLEAQARVQEMQDAMRKTIEEQERRFAALSDLERRKAVLAARRGCLDHAYELFAERVLQMDAAAYEELLYRWLAENAAGGDVLFAAQRDCGYFDQGKLEQKATDVHYGGVTDQVKTGFLLQQADTQVDCSVEAAILRLRDEEAQVARVLFDEAQEGTT